MTPPEIDAAIAALEPFALCADRNSASVQDWMVADHFTVGACRRARAALSGLKRLVERQETAEEQMREKAAQVAFNMGRHDIAKRIDALPLQESAGESVGTVAGTSAELRSALSEAGTAAPPADTLKPIPRIVENPVTFNPADAGFTLEEPPPEYKGNFKHSRTVPSAEQPKEGGDPHNPTRSVDKSQPASGADAVARAIIMLFISPEHTVACPEDLRDAIASAITSAVQADRERRGTKDYVMTSLDDVDRIEQAGREGKRLADRILKDMDEQLSRCSDDPPTPGLQSLIERAVRRWDRDHLPPREAMAEAIARAANDEFEWCCKFILGGRFLTDDAPPKRFAEEVVAGLHRARSKPDDRRKDEG